MKIVRSAIYQFEFPDGERVGLFRTLAEAEKAMQFRHCTICKRDGEFQHCQNPDCPIRHGGIRYPRFRHDNTDGYTGDDLAALNAAFEDIMDANADLWANNRDPDKEIAVGRIR